MKKLTSVLSSASGSAVSDLDLKNAVMYCVVHSSWPIHRAQLHACICTTNATLCSYMYITCTVQWSVDNDTLVTTLRGCLNVQICMSGNRTVSRLRACSLSAKPMQNYLDMNAFPR